MRLTIKSGESIENAMKYLQAFFDERKEEYPILKGNMNVYISLRGFGELICPENEKEYILTPNGIVDADEELLHAAISELNKAWKRWSNAQQECYDIRRIERMVEKDRQYLETAEEKGKRQELIDKREKQLNKNLERLKETKEEYAFYKRLIEHVNSGGAKRFFAKNRGNRYRSPSITAYLVIEDFEGFTGHFHKGYMNRGLPYGYKE